MNLFVGGTGSCHTYRIPALVVSPAGAVLAFCEGRKHSSADHGDVMLLLRRSLDGGRSWSNPIIVHDDVTEPDVTIGNPCPIADPRDGLVHLLFTRNNHRLYYTRSTDDGLKWAPPEDLTSILDALDYPLVRIAAGPGHGLLTRRGRLVAPIWVSDRLLEKRHESPTPRRFQSGVVYSDDGGRTWEAGGLVPPRISQLNEAMVVERRDGTLLLNMRAHLAGRRAVATSADGGKTWADPVLDEALTCPTCQAAMLGLGDGRILFANPAHVRTETDDLSDSRRQLTVRLSLDDGATWAHRRVLNEGPSGYSDLAIRPDGEVLCMYETGEQTYRERLALAHFGLDWVTGT